VIAFRVPIDVHVILIVKCITDASDLCVQFWILDLTRNQSAENQAAECEGIAVNRHLTTDVGMNDPVDMSLEANAANVTPRKGT
jgi:hypothetical protein